MRNAVFAVVLAGQPGKCLQHRIHGRPPDQWPALTESRNRQVDDSRLARADRVVIEAQSLDHARAETFDEDIRAFDQAPQHRLALFILEVDGHAALAQIADDRKRRMVAISDTEHTTPVAISRSLDLDDLRTLLREQHGAIGSSNALAKVDDLQTGKGGVIAHCRLLMS